MKEMVPLLQTLVWPMFIAVFLFMNRVPLGRVVASLAKRIEEGAPFKAGAIEVGSAPSLPPVPKDETDPRHVDELPHDYYLVHTARRDRSLDNGDQQYYRLRIFLDCETIGQLAEVGIVTYRLHPTFQDPVRRVTDPKGNFEIRTAAWGEFNMTAEISFKNGRGPLVVERYINLPGSSA